MGDFLPLPESIYLYIYRVAPKKGCVCMLSGCKTMQYQTHTTPWSQANSGDRDCHPTRLASNSRPVTDQGRAGSVNGGRTRSM